MADNDTAATTTTLADPPVNGFNRQTATTGPPTGAPAPGAAPPPRVQAWPAPAPDAGLSVDSSRAILLAAVQAHASGAKLETVEGWREVFVRQGEAQSNDQLQPMATTMLALVAEGRARAQGDDIVARTLRAAGMDQIAQRLTTAADGIAAAIGWNAPPNLTAPQSPSRAGVAAVFDALRDRLQEAEIALKPPPPDLAAATLPIVIQPQHLRTPAGLQRLMQAVLKNRTDLPNDVAVAISAVDTTLEVVGHEYPADRTARQIVGVNPAPERVAVRLRQIAAMLDARLPTDQVQRSALGSYEQGRHLSAQLRAVADEIDRNVADPAALAQARLTNHLETIKLTEPSPEASPESPAAAAAAVAPTQPSETAPEANQAPGEDDGATAGEDPQAAVPYRYNPELLPEHALLGALLHTPAAMTDLDAFLEVADFSAPDTQALYTTLRGLHRDHALFDVAALSSEAAQLDAANENIKKLFAALRASPPPYGQHSIADIPGLVSQIVRAAPPESIPFRGVYDPGALMRMGRMVLEDSIRRQLAVLGVRTERAKPSFLAVAQSLVAERGERAAQAMVTNLEAIETQVDAMAQRLVAAIKRTGPDADAAIAPTIAADTVDRARESRWRMPERLRAITSPLRHRAERHIIHLALHAGPGTNLPREILNLSPDAFASTRHANTWRVIKDLQARNLPVNYVAVDRESRGADFAHHPILPHTALTKMGEPPEIKPNRVARALRTLVTSALSRATKDSTRGIASVTAGAVVPVESALHDAKTTINGLTDRATTAARQHRDTTQWHQAQTQGATR